MPGGGQGERTGDGHERRIGETRATQPAKPRAAATGA